VVPLHEGGNALGVGRHRDVVELEYMEWARRGIE
jgi:hypothetical protein